MKLSTKHKFQTILDHGIRWNTGPLRFFALARPGETTKLGIIIPKKSYRRAVDRNRLKRLLRESLKKVNFVPGRDILIMVRSGIDPRKISRQKMELWLLSGLQKHSLILRPSLQPLS
ncbi:MAG: ribonuclease P protein component [Elusimicrobia bacterium]|nr:ribonuclease P protein component [Elusimicrobiota bacterium]